MDTSNEYTFKIQSDVDLPKDADRDKDGSMTKVCKTGLDGIKNPSILFYSSITSLVAQIPQNGFQFYLRVDAVFEQTAIQ